jgi:hypothetical protein
MHASHHPYTCCRFLLTSPFSHGAFNRALRREQQYKGLLLQMSPHLQGQVALHCYGRYLNSIPFLRVDTSNLSDHQRFCVVEEASQFLVQLAMKIVPTAYGPNELVGKQGDPADFM